MKATTVKAECPVDQSNSSIDFAHTTPKRKESLKANSHPPHPLIPIFPRGPSFCPEGRRTFKPLIDLTPLSLSFSLAPSYCLSYVPTHSFDHEETLSEYRSRRWPRDSSWGPYTRRNVHKHGDERNITVAKHAHVDESSNFRQMVIAGHCRTL